MARSSSPVLLLVLLLPFEIGCGEASSNDPVAVALRFDACAPLVLSLDPSATVGQVSGAQAAVDLWNRTATTRLSLAPGAGEAATIPLLFRPAVPFSHGFYDPGAGEILINDALAGHTLAVVIAHELGHAFGLPHVSGRPSVMTAGNLDVEPNTSDVDALAAVWGRCADVAGE